MGGDLKYVDGEKTAVLKMVEMPLVGGRGDGDAAQETAVPTTVAGLRKVKRTVVNVQQEGGEGVQVKEMLPVEGMKVRGARTIVGPYVQYVKGTGGSEAVIQAKEGMWEVRRGVKVDGGERRKKMVRRNRLLAERKAARK